MFENFISGIKLNYKYNNKKLQHDGKKSIPSYWFFTTLMKLFLILFIIKAMPLIMNKSAKVFCQSLDEKKLSLTKSVKYWWKNITHPKTCRWREVIYIIAAGKFVTRKICDSTRKTCVGSRNWCSGKARYIHRRMKWISTHRRLHQPNTFKEVLRSACVKDSVIKEKKRIFNAARNFEEAKQDGRKERRNKAIAAFNNHMCGPGRCI